MSANKTTHTAENPRKSVHLRNRWYDRMPDQARTYSWAWDHGIPLEYVTDYFTDKNGETPDEIRLYHAVTCLGKEYTALLLRCDNTIVTAYRYTGTNDERINAYIETMIDAHTYYE